MNGIKTECGILLQIQRGCVVILFVMLSACGTTAKSVLISAENKPVRSPDMVGKITNMTWIGDFGIYWEITVEETPADIAPANMTAEGSTESSPSVTMETATSLRKYRITILETSQLFFRTAETKPLYADYGDLAREQRVEVWFRGKFVETDPPQISARKLVIIRD